MHGLLSLFVCCSLTAADNPQTWRYLRPQQDKYVLESKVVLTRTDQGSTMVSYTERPREKMTLTIRFDKQHNLISAETLHVTDQASQKATLMVLKDAIEIRGGDKVERHPRTVNAIVTTAPDWCDILQLVQRYDAKQGGKQEFPGMWFHPAKKTLTPKFTIEHEAKVEVAAQDKKVSLDRYRVHLRSGGYVVWADGSRQVVKLMSAGSRAGGIVLEGWEKVAEKLKNP